MKTLSAPGVNDQVQLRFYPVGHFLSPDNSKATACPPSGNDKDCVGDKFESCLLQAACGGLVCQPTEQLRLAKFLHCFEGESASSPASAQPCTIKAGFDEATLATAASCASNATRADQAFASVQLAARSGMKDAKCFPWIVIDGVIKSKDPAGGCFGQDAGTTPLLPPLCDALQQKGAQMPPACVGL